MKLSENSLLAKWWMHVHGALPKSLCPFFWNTLLSIPLGILFFIGFLFPAEEFDKKKTYLGRLASRSGLGLILELVLFAIGFGIYEYVRAWQNFPTQTLWVTVGVLIVTGAVLLFLFIRRKVLDAVEKKRWERNERREMEKDIERPATGWQVVKGGLKAWYEKNCPVIEWQK